MSSDNLIRPHHDSHPSFVKWTADTKMCIFKPKGLNIVWGNDPQYWTILEDEEKPAELNQACWLEVTGSVDVEVGKTYQLGFSVSFKPDAYGWSDAPVFVSAKVGKKGKTIWKGIRSINQITSSGGKSTVVPDESEGRLEIRVPSTGLNRETKLYFGLYEVWTGKPKGGLMIHEAFVREVA